MAGTDITRLKVTGGPAVILVRPQLGENIGTAARAMANFGLSEMRIVAPRDGWPSESAAKAASGADWVLDEAKLYETTADAVADLAFIYATTARQRGMSKEVVEPVSAADALSAREVSGQHCGILFGGERSGLDNADIALADAILTYPVNPAFASLNLAQAVLIMSYEWQRAAGTAGTRETFAGVPEPAPREELFHFFEHLESELDAGGFLKPPEKTPVIIRNIRNLFHRAQLTSQEVRTLRGIIVALTGKRYQRQKAAE
ncbi:RNA methyltransferase [Tepidamorphus sp. 3E244]|uniref:RNA methyltransferase n=1 Tax=Tepidamorphus sp. 3E244 TaxID=3385498 RepID=UPI0038FC6F41